MLAENKPRNKITTPLMNCQFLLCFSIIISIIKKHKKCCHISKFHGDNYMIFNMACYKALRKRGFIG